MVDLGETVTLGQNAITKKKNDVQRMQRFNRELLFIFDYNSLLHLRS